MLHGLMFIRSVIQWMLSLTAAASFSIETYSIQCKFFMSKANFQMERVNILQHFYLTSIWADLSQVPSHWLPFWWLPWTYVRSLLNLQSGYRYWLVPSRLSISEGSGSRLAETNEARLNLSFSPSRHPHARARVCLVNNRTMRQDWERVRYRYGFCLVLRMISFD